MNTFRDNDYRCPQQNRVQNNDLRPQRGHSHQSYNIGANSYAPQSRDERGFNNNQKHYQTHDNFQSKQQTCETNNNFSPRRGHPYQRHDIGGNRYAPRSRDERGFNNNQKHYQTHDNFQNKQQTCETDKTFRPRRGHPYQTHNFSRNSYAPQSRDESGFKNNQKHNQTHDNFQSKQQTCETDKTFRPRRGHPYQTHNFSRNSYAPQSRDESGFKNNQTRVEPLISPKPVSGVNCLNIDGIMLELGPGICIETTGNSKNFKVYRSGIADIKFDINKTIKESGNALEKITNSYERETTAITDIVINDSDGWQTSNDSQPVGQNNASLNNVDNNKDNIISNDNTIDFNDCDDWGTSNDGQNNDKQYYIGKNGEIMIANDDDIETNDCLEEYWNLGTNQLKLIKSQDITEPNMQNRLCFLIDNTYKDGRFKILQSIKTLAAVRSVEWYYREYSKKILITIYCDINEENRKSVTTLLRKQFGMSNSNDIKEIEKNHCTLCFSPGFDHYVGGCKRCYYCYSSRCFSWFCPRNPNNRQKPKDFDPNQPNKWRKRTPMAIKFQKERQQHGISDKNHWNEGQFYLYDNYNELQSDFRSLDTERATSCRPGKVQPAVTIAISAPMLRPFEVQTVFYARINNSAIISKANTQYSGVLAADIESGIEPEVAKKYVLEILKNKILILMDGRQDLLGLDISSNEIKSNNIKIFDMAMIEHLRNSFGEKPSLRNMVYGYCQKLIQNYWPRKGPYCGHSVEKDSRFLLKTYLNYVKVSKAYAAAINSGKSDNDLKLGITKHFDEKSGDKRNRLSEYIISCMEANKIIDFQQKRKY